MPNRLAQETSPYLLQHAGNPVDWYPWGEEAFALARARDRPILLSVGYSSCHWCHVMERESFEDDETAALMNSLFVNVKVDREERPDVDALYMEAVIALTRQGGWPMTVFLTPAGRPFYGGTYYPPEPRMGMPSFRQLLDAVAQAYAERRDEIDAQADQLTSVIGSALRPATAARADRRTAVDQALATLRTQYDDRHGGFGGAPKFPPSPLLRSLVAVTGRPGADAMARGTLDAMAAGGIHDQLGGGFHRYAVDGIWLVPHFEKMLYDNALLADAYARAAHAYDDARYAEVARGVLGYLDRELLVDGGGLASAHDADTDGEEGATFVWTPDEVFAAVADEADARLALAVYDITAEGNFEGSSVLSRVRSIEEAALLVGVPADHAADRLARANGAMLAARERRPQPARDDKVLASWNGLALSAYATTARLLGDETARRRTAELASFLRRTFVRDDGRLLRTARDGRAKIEAFSEDYGAVACGLIDAHAAIGDLDLLLEAHRLALLAVELFDAGDGTFYLSARDGEPLVARTRSIDDNPLPAATSLLADALLRLGRIFAEPALEERAAAACTALDSLLERAPQALGHLLAVVARLAEPSREIAIVGAPDDPRTVALHAVAGRALGNDAVLVVADPATPGFARVPLLEGRTGDGTPRAYVCERFTCQLPAETPDELRAQLQSSGESTSQ